MMTVVIHYAPVIQVDHILFATAMQMKKPLIEKNCWNLAGVAIKQFPAQDSRKCAPSHFHVQEHEKQFFQL